jgi:5-methylthioadenosine/S-adenosylhomocysteine deaminase
MTDEVDILIKNITALTPDGEPGILRNIDIAIVDGVIAKIGKDLRMDSKEELDGRGKIALPGLIDAHTHVFQIFLRGALTMSELQRHPIWLKVLIPFEAEMDKEEAEISARLACLNMIKKGITAFSDAGGPYPEILAEAIKESGLRATITYSTMDSGVSTYTRTPEHNRDLVSKYRDGRIRGWYSIRQLMTSTDDLIEKTFKYAEEDSVGVHMHLCEEAIEIQHALTRWGRRPIEFLYEMGYLSSRVLAAHCAFLSRGDLDIISRTDLKVVHCPTINLMYMNFPRVPELLAKGVKVALGSDGGSYRGLDLFTEMNVMMAGMSGYYGSPFMDHNVISPKEALIMATRNGASALMLEKGGSLKEGFLADLTIINTRKPHLTPLHDPFTLPFFASGEDVSELIVDGKMVMKDGQVTTLDEDAIISEATELAPIVRERIQKILKRS